MTCLVINAGSSSLKVAIFELHLKELVKTHAGIVDWDQKQTFFSFTSKGEKQERLVLNKENKNQNLVLVFRYLKNLFPQIDLLGHRIVHGGDLFSEPKQITAAVKKQIKSLKSLAPLHNPIELKCIEITEQLWKGATQVGVFDTAYFRDLPKKVLHYPLPYSWANKKIKRYGFHGINHEYCVQQFLKNVKNKSKNIKVICCHLGNGCSISANKEKICVDTTMGFTPLEGVMMGTRSGSLDPGILIYLLKNKIYTLTHLEKILNHESGIKGASGISEDMREILKLRKKNSHALLAYEMFIDSISKGIACMMTSLEGCNGLIFSGGIGENAHQVRSSIIKKLGYLGFSLDSKKNTSNKGDIEISSSKSTTSVWVIHASEEKSIAKKCLKLL